MIRRALIARRKEKERDSLRYTREGGDEDDEEDKYEARYEAIGIEEAEKYKIHPKLNIFFLDHLLMMKRMRTPFLQ